MAGSISARSASGKRCQVSSLPNRENTEEAAHGQDLTVRAHRHLGLPDIAVAGISTLPPSYFNPSRFMSRMKESPSTARSSIVGALRAGLVRVVAGARKVLAMTPSKMPLCVDEEEPAHCLAVFDLLPKTLGGWPSRRSGGDLRRSRAHRARASTRAQETESSRKPVKRSAS